VEDVRRGLSERGEIRLRTLFEVALIFLVAYAAIQIVPALVVRLQFLDEMTVAANSPIDMSAGAIKRNLLATAEGYGLHLNPASVGVIRDHERKRTFVTATYEIRINFWPAYTYVWVVKEEVVGYYL
jgi:hypothetical protein